MTERAKLGSATLLLRSAIVVVTAVFAGGLVYLALQIPQQRNPAEFGGPFTLKSSNGGTLSRASLAGKPYALFFGYTNCPDFCPTTMMDLASLMNKEGEKAKDFNAYFISIDPERDTQAILKEYLTAFDPRIVGLTGTPEEINAVLKAFKVYRHKNGSGDSYTFDHTASVMLFDRSGGLAGIISANEPEADQQKKLDRLLSS